MSTVTEARAKLLEAVQEEAGEALDLESAAIEAMMLGWEDESCGDADFCPGRFVALFREEALLATVDSDGFKDTWEYDTPAEAERDFLAWQEKLEPQEEQVI